MSPERGGVRYRADIDGLRALAVAAVILYHARVPGFPGGYVGVDVFFVISGFVITQVLQARAHQPRARVLLQFYLRRARRLLPALFVVLIVCTAVAVSLYLPADLRNFGRSLILAVAFLGNFGAALLGGYFDPGARFAPLRHLWSLGVEEQFYLFYPLALFMILAMASTLRRASVAAAAMLSLLLSFWGAIHAPILNFFMLPTRAWELLLGAFVALSPALFPAAPRTRQLSAAVGLAGLLLVICYARVIIFPGRAAIVASVCTAVLIAGNSSGSMVARLLSLRPVVFTGLISYSLYLWHAPALAFFDYYNIHEPTAAVTCLLLLLVYLIAATSWVAVEQPFRARKLAAAPALFLCGALIISLALAGAGYGLVRSAGLPQRWTSPLPKVVEESPEFSAFAARCSATSVEEIAAGHLCSFGPQNDAAKKVVVWGDSHAGVLLPTYESLAIADNIRIYFGIRGACWPLPGAEAASSGEFWRTRCAKFNAAMVQAIERLNPQRVILNAYWLDPGAATEAEFRRRNSAQGSEVTDALSRLLDSMQSKGRSVCAVLTVPGYKYPIPYALAVAQRRGIDADTLPVTRSEALSQFQTVEGAMRSRQNQLRVADPKDVLCPAARCLIRAPDGALLYRDANHMSPAGARFLSGVVEQCLADLH